MTRVVLFSSNIGDVPANLAFKNNYEAEAAPTVNDDASAGYTAGSVWIYNGNVYTCTDNTEGAAVWAEGQSELTNPISGVAAGYKIARGTHQQAAAADTIATGLATVVAVVVSFKDSPTINQLWAKGDVGNQSGAPVAGSFILSTFKPTAVNDCTPIAATVFSDNVHFDWIAIGT